MVSFPASPAFGTTVTGPNGQVWMFDTVKWRIAPPKRRETLPIGVIASWTTDTVPARWLACDGSAISRSTYSALFGVLDTGYGVGDGSTTFNLPDYRSLVFVGIDLPSTGRLSGASGISQPFSVGYKGGHQLLHPHNHTVSDPGHTHSAWDVGHGHGQDPHGHGLGDPGHQHHRANHTHSNWDPWHGHGIWDGTHWHGYSVSVANWDGWLQPVNLAGGLLPEHWSNFEGAGIGIWFGGAGVGGHADWGDGGWFDLRATSTHSNVEYAWVHTGYVNVNVGAAASGISTGVSGAGDMQNLQPCIVVEKIIYAGV